MATGIGEKLRLERETRGIALRDISEQTRISMRYLEAIETDDYRRLPGGIFNRSFIRAYAKFVGYDEDEAIEEYSRTQCASTANRKMSRQSTRSQVYTDDSATTSRSPLRTIAAGDRNPGAPVIGGLGADCISIQSRARTETAIRRRLKLICPRGEGGSARASCLDREAEEHCASAQCAPACVVQIQNRRRPARRGLFVL